MAGHAGLVGSAIMRRLRAEGFTNVLVARRDQLDLRDQAAVNYWFRATRPEYVLLVAGTHVDDLADACLFLMERYDDDGHINVGTGVDLSIRALAELVRDIVNPSAELAFDTSKPDGTPRKVLDVSKRRGLGWSPKIGLDDGIRSTYEWFLDASAANTVRARDAVVKAP